MRRFTIMVPMGIGLLLGGVALGLGLRSQGAGADVVGEIEQQRLPNARLTNPVIEAVAVRSESGPLKQLEDELSLWGSGSGPVDRCERRRAVRAGQPDQGRGDVPRPRPA